MLLSGYSAVIFASDDESLPTLQMQAQLATTEFYVEQDPVLPYGYLSGFTLSNVADNVLKMERGAAKDSEGNWDIVRVTPISKVFNCTGWQPGDGACGLAPNLTLKAGTTYHIFAVMDGAGNVDMAADDHIDGLNIKYYTSYKTARRIASLYTSSDPAHPVLVEFKQSGDTFFLKAGVSSYNQYPSPPDGLVKLNVPNGIETIALLNLYFSTTGSTVYAYYFTPGLIGNFDLLAYSDGAASSSTYKQVLTNTSAQIEIKFTGAVSQSRATTIITQGWIDHRGRL